MKNDILRQAVLLVGSILAGCLLSCNKDEPLIDPAVPEISVMRPEAYPHRGGTYSISYRIRNPGEYILPEVSTNDEWITELTADDVSISFILTENCTGDDRNGKISLTYEGAEAVDVPIRQNGIRSLDSSGTANCYIIQKSGEYRFPAVKGNSGETVEGLASVVVLWETFGTDTAPEKGDLIAEVSYDSSSNTVLFRTASAFRKGNALIAAKDASGKILWSWHIWMTEQPEDQVYNNNAGIMMDRNLGAVSSARDDIGALGLIYQWGRKDPFPGASSIGENTSAKSTFNPWPQTVPSDVVNGTLDFAVANPTVFITIPSGYGDWLYTVDNEDRTRWQSKKTIYDPCPPGYRVPDGGEDGVWAKAFGTSELFSDSSESGKKGFDFGPSGESAKKLSGNVTGCWYPAAGYVFNANRLNVGMGGLCWSCSYHPSDEKAYVMKFITFGFIYPAEIENCAYGCSVRCMKDNIN